MDHFITKIVILLDCCLYLIVISETFFYGFYMMGFF